MSGGQAFPPSLLTSASNMSDHFACISMISEKRRQCNTYLTFVIRKLDKFKVRAEREGSLDDEDIKRANEAVNEAKEEMKKHKAAISKELDNLKRIIHAELTSTRNPMENVVQVNVNKMYQQEWEEEEEIVEELEKKMDGLKKNQKRKEPPVQNLDQHRDAKDKDPDSQLSPGMLSYEITPAQLESWMSSFRAYVENGKGLGNKAIVAYIRKFLDEDYRQSNVYSLIRD